MITSKQLQPIAKQRKFRKKIFFETFHTTTVFRQSSFSEPNNHYQSNASYLNATPQKAERHTCKRPPILQAPSIHPSNLRCKIRIKLDRPRTERQRGNVIARDAIYTVLLCGSGALIISRVERLWLFAGHSTTSAFSFLAYIHIYAVRSVSSWEASRGSYRGQSRMLTAGVRLYY